MKKTVVAIFNSVDEAKNAANQLLSNGFTSNNIDVSSGKKYAEGVDKEKSGISRFFDNLFGNNDEKSERYKKVAERGYVVTVYAYSDEEAQQASALLDDYGAIDVDENYDKHFSDKKYVDDRIDNRDVNYGRSNENYIANRDNYDTRDQKYSETERSDDLEDINKTIPVIEENLTVGKKEVTTGGVRIRSRIVEKPVEENLRLREEHIVVERHKVDRPATDEELKNFKTRTVELTEYAEIPDVQKRSTVVEEVSLGKKVEHRDETVRDNVKKTEVDVQNIDPDDRNSNT